MKVISWALGFLCLFATQILVLRMPDSSSLKNQIKLMQKMVSEKHDYLRCEQRASKILETLKEKNFFKSYSHGDMVKALYINAQDQGLEIQDFRVYEDVQENKFLKVTPMVLRLIGEPEFIQSYIKIITNCYPIRIESQGEYLKIWWHFLSFQA